MSWRCQRSRASGRTRKVCHLRLGSSWARTASRARSASKRGWPTWRCSYGELVAQDQDLDVLVTSGSEVKDDQLEGGPYRAGEKPEGHRAGSVVAVSPGHRPARPRWSASDRIIGTHRVLTLAPRGMRWRSPGSGRSARNAASRWQSHGSCRRRAPTATECPGRARGQLHIARRPDERGPHR